MRSQRLEIEHLPAACFERVQQTAFAGAGQAAHDAPVKFSGQRCEIGDHRAPVGFVAAVELRGVPADLMQHVGECAAAAAAAPAIDERAPAARAVVETLAQMPRDVGADQRGAGLLGLERGHLLVERADPRALVVVEYRAVDRARDMVLGEFAFRAHVDDLVKLGELCYGHYGGPFGRMRGRGLPR